MRKIILTVIAVISATVLFAQNRTENIVKVSSTVDTLVQPNKIELYVTIQSDKGAGKKGMEEAQIKLYNILKKQNVDTDKDLRVISYNSYHRAKGERIFIYRTYSVMLYDIESVNTIFELSNTSKIGNVRINSIYNTDNETHINNLTAKALLKARSNAAFQAEVLGQSIGSAIYISKGYSSGGREYLGATRMISTMAEESNAEEGANVDIKDIKVSVTFEVHFTLLGAN